MKTVYVLTEWVTDGFYEHGHEIKEIFSDHNKALDEQNRLNHKYRNDPYHWFDLDSYEVNTKKGEEPIIPKHLQPHCDSCYYQFRKSCRCDKGKLDFGANYGKLCRDVKECPDFKSRY